MDAASSHQTTAVDNQTATATPAEVTAGNDNHHDNNNNNNDSNDSRAQNLAPAPQLPPLHTSQALVSPKQVGSDADSPTSPSSQPLSPSTPYPPHANHKEHFRDDKQQEKKPAEPVTPFAPVPDAKKWGCILWAVYFACMALVVMFWLRPQPLAAIQYCELSSCKQYKLAAGLDCAGRVTKALMTTGYVAFTLVVQVDNANWLPATVADVQLDMDDGGVIEYATCVGSGKRLKANSWGLMTVDCKLYLTRPAVTVALVKFITGDDIPIRVTGDGIINKNNYTVFLTESLVQDKSCKQGIDLPYYVTDFYTSDA
eukprot:jgi/Chlat1/7030/Chrsp56S06699